MGAPKITLYVDVVSPFAYIAYQLLRTSPTFKECEIIYVPVFLGGIMKETGNRPPIAVKAKYKWIELDRKRWASMFNIKIAESAPDNFPVNTVYIQRALVAISMNMPEKLPEAIDEMYRGFWVERNEGKVASEGLPKYLSNVFGKDGAEKIMKESSSDAVKKTLGQNTNEALNEGAFGLPYMIGTNAQGQKEPYWGVNSMGQLIDHLGLDRSKLGDRAHAMM